MSRPEFRPEQAQTVARAFAQHGVDYLFIGKSGAILLGFPAVTQDVDVFPSRTFENAERIVAALRSADFEITDELEQAILKRKDFVQIKTGPFDLDLVFSPDGIQSYEEAKKRSLLVDGFPVANLRDIIASKRASGRDKDLKDLDYLERFRQEYERLHPTILPSAADIASKRYPSN